MFCVASTEIGAIMNITKGGLVLFSANSNSSCTELSRRIAERLGVEMGKVQVYQEPNRETRVQIQESVRGKDVFIIQTVSKDVNTTIMELLIMVYACKTSCAKSIIGVIPYFPYSKQCKMRKRGSIVSKLLASMMCKAGLTHLITMDLHQKEIQGFFDIPVDNLRASPFLLQYIQEEIPDYRNAVIVAKSPASAKRAQSFAERLRLGIAVIHGEAQDAESDLVDGRHSPPTAKSVAAIHPSLEIPTAQLSQNPPCCPSRRLAQIRKSKKKTRDEMFNELLQNSHTESTRQTEWRERLLQSRLEARAASERREQQWMEREQRMIGREDKRREREESRLDAFLRVMEDQTEMLWSLVKLQQDQRSPLQPLSNHLPKSHSFPTQTRGENMGGKLRGPTHSTPRASTSSSRMSFSENF